LLLGNRDASRFVCGQHAVVARLQSAPALSDHIPVHGSRHLVYFRLAEIRAITGRQAVLTANNIFLVLSSGYLVFVGRG
jgi:hypothetical protein